MSKKSNKPLELRQLYKARAIITKAFQVLIEARQFETIQLTLKVLEELTNATNRAEARYKLTEKFAKDNRGDGI